MCDEAIESFMKGNFSRLDRTLERLDHVKTTTIRKLLNQEELHLMQTEEDDFNDRFRNEAAGSSGLMGLDDMEDEEEEEKNPTTGNVTQTRLTSGNMDKDMQREMLL
jgi:hypothetical protein